MKGGVMKKKLVKKRKLYRRPQEKIISLFVVARW